jgi:dGTPase
MVRGSWRFRLVVVRDAWVARRSGTVRHADDARSDFEIDHARVVHSSSFRRLQGKTQILAIGDDDFYRTRLTHSLEVAQVSAGILQQLAANGSRLPEDLLGPSSLVSAVSLAHDLGHPPFGHGGELALNYCMRDDGGFEGNAQTLRILTRLETFSRDNGADLTRRSLLGVLKYPATRSRVKGALIDPKLVADMTMVATLDHDACLPPKACYDEDADVVDWILERLPAADRSRFLETSERPGRHARTLHKSFDCTVMDLADDVAYGVHDLEDGIALGLIERDRFGEAISPELCELFIDALRDRPLEGGGSGYEAIADALFGGEFDRKKAVGRLVHFFLRSVHVAVIDGFDEPVLAHRVELSKVARDLLDALQKLVVDDVIEHPRVQHLEFKGQRMVVSVFEALRSDPRRLLPRAVFAAYERSNGGVRVLCDHVAAMTDGSLVRTYERLFSPRMGSVFDRH